MPVVMRDRSTVKVSKDGTLEIPKAIISTIAASPGERFRIERDGYGLRLVHDPALPKKTVDQVAGCLRDVSKKKRTDTEINRDIGAFIKAQDEATKGR
ncbi:MAG: hypothetical protein Q8O25_13230 [Sulfurisoma sp.]|nr:hypothetical protein [Sulfurisoma sp.]